MVFAHHDYQNHKVTSIEKKKKNIYICINMYICMHVCICMYRSAFSLLFLNHRPKGNTSLFLYIKNAWALFKTYGHYLDCSILAYWYWAQVTSLYFYRIELSKLGSSDDPNRSPLQSKQSNRISEKFIFKIHFWIVT